MISIIEKLNVKNINIDNIFNYKDIKILNDYTEFKDWSPNTFNSDIRSFISQYFKPNKKVYVLIDDTDGNNEEIKELIREHRNKLNLTEENYTSATYKTKDTPGSTVVVAIYENNYIEIFVSTKNQKPNTLYFMIQK